MKNLGWLSADMQVRIDPPPIPLFEAKMDDDCTTHKINIKIRKKIIIGI